MDFNKASPRRLSTASCSSCSGPRLEIVIRRPSFVRFLAAGGASVSTGSARLVKVNTSDRVAAPLGLLLGVIGLSAVVLGGLYRLTAEPYWTYHARIYDSMRNEYRCIDPDTRELSSIASPCLVLTRHGRAAVDHQTTECVKRGGSHEGCWATAWDWINAQKPR